MSWDYYDAEEQKDRVRMQIFKRTSRGERFECRLQLSPARLGKQTHRPLPIRHRTLRDGLGPFFH